MKKLITHKLLIRNHRCESDKAANYAKIVFVKFFIFYHFECKGCNCEWLHLIDRFEFISFQDFQWIGMLTTSALSVENLISEEKQGIIKYFVTDDNNYLTFFRYLTLMYCIDVTRRWAGGICLTLRSWFAEAVVMCPRYS